LSPFAPHVAEELWSVLGHNESVTAAPFPVFDAAKLATDTMTVAVQVNGKLRGTVEIAADAGEAQVLEAARNTENVARFIEGKRLVKEIYVPGRIVNLVAK